jgi:hypothetical protein
LSRATLGVYIICWYLWYVGIYTISLSTQICTTHLRHIRDRTPSRHGKIEIHTYTPRSHPRSHCYMLPDALEARARADTLRCTRDCTPEPPYGKIEIHAEIAPEVTPLHVTDALEVGPGPTRYRCTPRSYGVARAGTLRYTQDCTHGKIATIHCPLLTSYNPLPNVLTSYNPLPTTHVLQSIAHYSLATNLLPTTH